MNFTKEMLEKARTAQSAEELKELAKAEGMELTEQEAEKYFAELHKMGELADEELDNVSGGGCGGDDDDGSPKPRFEAGDYVIWYPKGRYNHWGDPLPQYSVEFIYAIVLAVTAPVRVYDPYGQHGMGELFSYTIEYSAGYGLGTDMGDGSEQAYNVREDYLTPQ